MAQKIRVAFFTDMLVEDLDGALRTVFQLLDRIPVDEFEFLFFTGAEPKNPVKHFRIVKMPRVSLFINAGYVVVLPQFDRGKMKKELDDFKPDVIHITTPSWLGFKALNYSLDNKIPAVAIYHTHFISYPPYYLKGALKGASFILPYVNRWLMGITKGFYEKCSNVFYPTLEIVEDLEKLGVNTDNKIMWERGINLETFSVDKRDKTYMQKITGNDKPVILFVSRLVWEKNLETLIEIYKIIEEKQLGYNVVIAGDGAARKAFGKTMPNAYFLGNVPHDELARTYASSDVFVFPSETETFGNVVLEAMASGLPCVVANGGGSRSFITDGENGFLCEPKNAKQYLDKIKIILENEDLRKQFINKGLNQSGSFDWDNLARRYFDHVTHLVRNNKTS